MIQNLLFQTRDTDWPGVLFAVTWGCVLEKTVLWETAPLSHAHTSFRAGVVTLVHHLFAKREQPPPPQVVLRLWGTPYYSLAVVDGIENSAPQRDLLVCFQVSYCARGRGIQTRPFFGFLCPRSADQFRFRSRTCVVTLGVGDATSPFLETHLFYTSQIQ